MLKWIMENKKWLFSGVAVSVPLAIIGWLCFQGGDPPPRPNDNSIHQTHSGTGDNVGGDKNVTTDNSVRQTNIGATNVAGRDQTINNYLLGSVDYQQLVKDIKDGEEMLAGISSERIDLRLKQSAKVKELKQGLEEFKADVFRLHELFTQIPINTERLRRAKEHFNKGEFREADAVLKAEEIQQDVERLQKEKEADQEKRLAIEQDLQLFNYYIIHKSDEENPKWQEPRADRMMTWDEANKYVAEKNEEGLMGYHDWRLPAIGELQELANFVKNFPGLYSDTDKLYWSSQDFGPYSVECKVVNLGNAKMGWYDVDQQVATRSKNNRFSVRLVRTVNQSIALLEYEEALKHYHSLAEQNPEAFLPNVASTLLSLSIFFLQDVPDKEKSIAYAQEARDILIPLCKQVPHLQYYLDKAEEVLKRNKAKPEA